MKTVSREEVLRCKGLELETTDWFTVTQDQIDQFADSTLDHQFIHIDPQKAKDTIFGSTIAHGFLSLSMLSHFAKTFSLKIEGCHLAVNYGFNKVRFIAPVKVNSRIRCHARVLDVVERTPGQFMITNHVQVEIDGSDKPALIAEWIGLQLID